MEQIFTTHLFVPLYFLVYIAYFFISFVKIPNYFLRIINLICIIFFWLFFFNSLLNYLKIINSQSIAHNSFEVLWDKIILKEFYSNQKILINIICWLLAIVQFVATMLVTKSKYLLNITKIIFKVFCIFILCHNMPHRYNYIDACLYHVLAFKLNTVPQKVFAAITVSIILISYALSLWSLIVLIIHKKPSNTKTE